MQDLKSFHPNKVKAQAQKRGSVALLIQSMGPSAQQHRKGLSWGPRDVRPRVAEPFAVAPTDRKQSLPAGGVSRGVLRSAPWDTETFVKATGSRRTKRLRYTMVLLSPTLSTYALMKGRLRMEPSTGILLMKPTTTGKKPLKRRKKP